MHAPVAEAHTRLANLFDPLFQGCLTGPARRLSGVACVEREEKFAEPDILSLHCPLTPETHHMIRAETLPLLKPAMMLINTSRGAVM